MKQARSGWSWRALGVPEGMVREHDAAAGQLTLEDPPRDLVERTIEACLRAREESQAPVTGSDERRSPLSPVLSFLGSILTIRWAVVSTVVILLLGAAFLAFKFVRPELTAELLEVGDTFFVALKSPHGDRPARLELLRIEGREALSKQLSGRRLVDHKAYLLVPDSALVHTEGLREALKKRNIVLEQKKITDEEYQDMRGSLATLISRERLGVGSLRGVAPDATSYSGPALGPR